MLNRLNKRRGVQSPSSNAKCDYDDASSSSATPCSSAAAQPTKTSNHRHCTAPSSLVPLMRPCPGRVEGGIPGVVLTGSTITIPGLMLGMPNCGSNFACVWISQLHCFVCCAPSLLLLQCSRRLHSSALPNPSCMALRAASTTTAPRPEGDHISDGAEQPPRRRQHLCVREGWSLSLSARRTR